MKKVGLLCILLLTWVTVTVVDLPVVHAGDGHEIVKPPADVYNPQTDGDDSSDGDPDDIIEGNRRHYGNSAEPGDPQDGCRDRELVRQMLMYLRLLVSLQR